jgi:hypothetical protein
VQDVKSYRAVRADSARALAAANRRSDDACMSPQTEGRTAVGQPVPNLHRARNSMTFDSDSTTWPIASARTFDELTVGEIFRAPSRTLTSAHASAFQAVSCDNHPIHYDVEYAHRFGHPAPLPGPTDRGTDPTRTRRRCQHRCHSAQPARRTRPDRAPHVPPAPIMHPPTNVASS